MKNTQNKIERTLENGKCHVYDGTIEDGHRFGHDDLLHYDYAISAIDESFNACNDNAFECFCDTLCEKVECENVENCHIFKKFKAKIEDFR